MGEKLGKAEKWKLRKDYGDLGPGDRGAMEKRLWRIF